MTCSLCDSDFDLDGEGGIDGLIGILPVHLCPYCWNGLNEAVEFYRDCIHGDECGICNAEKYCD